MTEGFVAHTGSPMQQVGLHVPRRSLEQSSSGGRSVPFAAATGGGTGPAGINLEPAAPRQHALTCGR